MGGWVGGEARGEGGGCQRRESCWPFDLYRRVSEEGGAVGGDGVLGQDGRGGVEGLAAVQHHRLGVGEAKDEELGGAGIDEVREVLQVEHALAVEVLQLDVADTVVPAGTGRCGRACVWGRAWGRACVTCLQQRTCMQQPS